VRETPPGRRVNAAVFRDGKRTQLQLVPEASRRDLPFNTDRLRDSVDRFWPMGRGTLGVVTQEMTPELAESFSLKNADGALIAGVLKGGPADAGGVRPGDILLAVNGNKVSDSASLLNLIAELKPGEKAQLTVARKQQSLNLKIQVGLRPMQRTLEPAQEPEIN
jgi:S1-C subfamily serine protease